MHPTHGGLAKTEAQVAGLTFGQTWTETVGMNALSSSFCRNSGARKDRASGAARGARAMATSTLAAFLSASVPESWPSFSSSCGISCVSASHASCGALMLAFVRSSAPTVEQSTCRCISAVHYRDVLVHFTISRPHTAECPHAARCPTGSLPVTGFLSAFTIEIPVAGNLPELAELSLSKLQALYVYK